MKNIPYIVIAILIAVIAFNNCEGGSGSNNIVDTVTVTKIDTVYKIVQGSAQPKPKVVTIKDTINHYITVSDSCKLPHLNEKGILLVNFRNYKDTVNIEGYKIGYNADVIGELQSINLSLYGNVPTIRQNTLRTVTVDRSKYNSLVVYGNYNQSPQLGLAYRSNKITYSLNYDLQYKSLGVQIGYSLFSW